MLHFFISLHVHRSNVISLLKSFFAVWVAKYICKVPLIHSGQVPGEKPYLKPRGPNRLLFWPSPIRYHQTRAPAKFHVYPSPKTRVLALKHSKTALLDHFARSRLVHNRDHSSCQTCTLSLKTRLFRAESSGAKVSSMHNKKKWIVCCSNIEGG